MDDLFGIGTPDSDVKANPFAGMVAGGGTDAPAAAPATPQQFGSRREARDAGSRPATPVSRTPVSRKQELAASRRTQLSRPSADRRAVRSAAREVDQHEPASRKLRRREVALMHAAAPRGPRKSPIRGLATFAIVGGLFACAGLPAYAVSNTATLASAKQATTTAEAQSIVVSADATVLAAARDGYRATTPEEIAEMSKDDIRAQNNADYMLSGARELGDDYPYYYELSSAQGGGLSPLNYYYRECVDFVAWRLNRDQGSYAAPFKWVWSTLTPTGGNASQWEYAWEQHGWPVSTTPIVGSVAWFGWSNHVAYVKAVNADGTVTIEEYNYIPGVYSQRTIPASSVESFLYPPS